MPVVGAVLVLSPDVEARRACLDALTCDARITLGEQLGDRLPVAVATDSMDEDLALWRRLQAMPGVVHTDVVWATVDEEEGTP